MTFHHSNHDHHSPEAFAQCKCNTALCNVQCTQHHPKQCTLYKQSQNTQLWYWIHDFLSHSFWSDDGGHDVIDNFEFPCNSMENLISIWNFTNTVIKDVKQYENFKSVKPLRRYLRYFRGTHWRSSLSRRLLAFYTWMNRVTHCLYVAHCRSRGIGEWLKRLFCSHGRSCPPSSDFDLP